MPLKLRRVSHALGAEVVGLDISKPLDDTTVAELRKAFLENYLLLFRGHPLTREQHVAFSRRFGNIGVKEGHTDRHPDMPEMASVLSKPTPDGKAPTGRFQGEDWHTDHSHMPAPCMATLLYALELPELGGDTQFCDMYRAYETLSDGMKKLLEGVHGVHMEGRAVIDRSSPERYAESRRLNPAAAHPVVRVHPETGRKALYVNRQVKLLVGMTADESRPLIDFLTRHATPPQGVYRHRWQQHDLVMWDNRCLMHMALGDFDRTKVRHMHKTTVDGTPLGYRYDGPLD
jgi:taurine dioxygenase